MKSSIKRDGFDEAWRKALGNAEKAPPLAVWDRIESGVAGAETGKYKRRLMYFKWVAAASVLLTVSLALYTWYIFPSIQESDAVANYRSSESGGAERATESDNMRSSDVLSSKDEHSIAKPSNELPTSIDIDKRALITESPKQSDLNDAEDQSGRLLPFVAVDGQVREKVPVSEYAFSQPAVSDRQHFAAVSVPGRQWHEDVMTVQTGERLEMYRIPVIPAKEKVRVPVQLLAGLSFSTGQFDPGFQENSQAFFRSSDLMAFEASAIKNVTYSMADDANALSSEEYQPSVAYAYGLNFGTRLSRRWTLQSGLTYINANSWANTSAYYVDPRSNEKTAVLRAANSQAEGIVQLVQTEEIQLKNSYNFASIPLKAGYIVLDKKLNIAMLAGVTGDFLLKNHISDSEELINEVTNRAGIESPYKPLYFNGTLGASLGYMVADHYYLNMEPSYRMALSDLTKEDFSLTSRPNSFYLTFGISYRFK